MSREYIAAFLAADPQNDLEQAGVKGMRWGVRRDRSTLRAAAKARTAPAKKESTPEKASASSAAPAKKPAGNIQDNVESSTARYDRISGQAKAGRASDLSEADLKFFNARTDALAKVNKMNETQPTWLAETSKKVLQQTAQNQMQAVADGIAKKYIGGPILDAINGTKEAASTPAVSKAIKSTVEKTKDAVDPPKSADTPDFKPPAYPGNGPAIPQASTSAPKHRATVGDRMKEGFKEGWNYKGPSTNMSMNDAANSNVPKHLGR